MGFLSGITSVVTKILPKVRDFVVGGLNALDGTDAQVDQPTRFVGMPNPNYISSLDGPVDENDRKGEECLIVTHEDITKRQAAEAIVNQARIEHLVLDMPVEGLTRSQVVVTGTYSFQFGPRLLKSGKTETEVTNYIQEGDHVSFQLTPRRYNNFTQLTRHELIKFSTCRITSQVTSGYDTSTIVGYIPFVKNTGNINNTILGMLTKRVNLQPTESLDFTIRYVSPALVDYDKTKSTYTPKSMFLEPNKVVRADYIRHLYKDEGDTQTMFSYGTVVVLKENTGEQTVSCKYKVEMIFDVWDYIDTSMSLEEAQKEWDDEHKPSGGSGSDSSDSNSGSSSTGACASRRRKAN